MEKDLFSLSVLKDLWSAAAFLIAAQIAAFTWRVNREVAVSKGGRDIKWFPIADYMNALGLIIALLGVFALPSTGIRLVSPLHAFGLSIVLFAGYPFALAAHYELFTIGDRTYQYFPLQERVAVGITALMALGYAVHTWLPGAR